MTDYDHPLAQSLRFLFSSDHLLQHPHTHIRISLFQLVIRYLPFFQNQSLHPPNSNYTASVLGLLLGSGCVMMTSRSGTTDRTIQQEEAVMGHSILTLLRFVKANLTAVTRYTKHILAEFDHAKLLTVQYFPSSEWTIEPPVSTLTQVTSGHIPLEF